MGFTEAVKVCLRKYVDFKGRARRSEYWFWTLAQGLVLLAVYAVLIAVTVATGALGSVDDSGVATAGGGIVSGLVGLVFFVVALGLFLPSLAVTVRRLHDTGRSGWWYLISLAPFGGIVLLVFCVMDSTPGPNQFGPNPKGIGDFAPYGQFPSGPNQYGNPSQFG
ncbi:DUF805 domain-containing protein [Kineococcus sp. GCM10028916]